MLVSIPPKIAVAYYTKGENWIEKKQKSAIKMGISQILCKLQMLALKENGMRRRAGLPVRYLVCLGTEILRAVKGDGVSRRLYTLDGQRISVTPACDLRNIW